VHGRDDPRTIFIHDAHHLQDSVSVSLEYNVLSTLGMELPGHERVLNEIQPNRTLEVDTRSQK
jgi:hypothetical protein